MKLPYFIFTSGEDGTSGVDWGVKHASPNFTDHYDLDREYRQIVSSFGLDPRMMYHEGENNGILILPWRDGFIVGFVFPYTDSQAGRPNTSLVAAVVPKADSKRLAPKKFIEMLLLQNHLEDIAKRETDRKNISMRPDTLRIEEQLDEDLADMKAYPSFAMQIPNSLSWPSVTQGFLYLGERQKILTRKKSDMSQEPQKQTAEKGRAWMKMFAAAALLICLPAVVLLMNNSSDARKETTEADNESSTITEAPPKNISKPGNSPAPAPLDEHAVLVKNILERIVNERKIGDKNLDGLVYIGFLPFLPKEDSDGQMILQEEKVIIFAGAPSIKTKYIQTNLKDGSIHTGRNQAIESIERIIKESKGEVISVITTQNSCFELKGVENWKELPDKLFNAIAVPTVERASSSLQIEEVQSKMKNIIPQKDNDNEPASGYILFLFETGYRGLYEALFIDDKGKGAPEARYYKDSDADVIVLDKKELKKRLSVKDKKNQSEPCLEQGKESTENYYLWLGNTLPSTIGTDRNSLIKEFAKSLLNAVSLKP